MYQIGYNSLPPAARSRTVTAILGPTNTGKTHLAIERMVAHQSGVIGLPLRLLAREVYARVTEKVGADRVALITGEEKILPKNPRFWVSTVEAMPLDLQTDFVAIDEVQLAGDFERGHVFTDRILNLRGQSETLLLGAATARPLLERLLPGVNVVTRPRMSILTYAGSRKITRLPPRSAVVAFSSSEVYAIAELIRRQRGGAAVVLGSLSPRTRNAQVELFQNGDVDHIIATDAVGMGLNLDVDHVAFAGSRKFDGFQYRNLSPAEMGQIAGRAGRHMRDGTFGITGRVDPLDDDLVRLLETHQFPALKMFQWRNSSLDYSSLRSLRQTLDAVPGEHGLTRAPIADDLNALEYAARNPEIRDRADSAERVKLLWDVCQVPDYRKIAPANHAALIADLYTHLICNTVIPDDWFLKQVAFADRVDGDIDTLANRIAHIRTWTFVANRADWLNDPAHWQGVTRGVEDRLSDALHERLIQRFVDRRTSVLMRRLRENAMLEAEITPTGDVLVENQHVGHLQGFRFAPDTAAEGQDGKAVRAAAHIALTGEIEKRAEKLSRCANEDLILSVDGTVRWQGQAVAKLVAGPETLKPGVVVLADENLTGAARDSVLARLDLWVKNHVETLLKPLTDLLGAEGLEGLARGVAYRVVEGLGIVERHEISDDVRQLDQNMRASLRRLGVRFGAYHIYVPALLKPAPSQLIAQLWALKNADLDIPGLSELPQLSASGRTSIPVDPQVSAQLYKVVGFRVCGPRAVRVDILERLADIIRPLVAWKPLAEDVSPPEGAVATGGAFTVTVAMTSLLGCAGEDFTAVLKSLGYRLETREIQRPAAVPTAVAADSDAGGAAKEKTAVASDQPPSGEETTAPGGAMDESEASKVEASTSETSGEDEAVAAKDEGAQVTASAESARAVETSDVIAPEGEVSVEAAPAPCEPEMETVTVEIWRPGRHDRRPRGRGQDGARRDQRRAGVDGQAAEGRSRNSGNRTAAEGRSSASRGEAASRGQGRNNAAGEATGNRAPKPGKGKGEGARPRDDKRAQNRGSNRGSAPARDKPVDPNSPFAALLALKANLEKGGK